MKKLLAIFYVSILGISNIWGQTVNDAYEKLNDEKYNQALQMFNSILSNDKDCLECLYGRAKAKYFLKNFNGALLDCETSLKDSTDRQYSYSLLGNIKYQLKDYKGAITAYEKALAIQKTEDEKRNDGKNLIIETQFYNISKIKYQAIKENRPELGKFVLDVSFLDRIISNKLTPIDLYRHVYDYVEGWKDETFEEYNKQTGKHDMIVYSPKIILNYRGSKIILTVKSLNNNSSLIYSINVEFNCACSWFNMKNEAVKNGYRQIEYSDEPDTRTSYFGGLDIKYQKGSRYMYYNKFHSKLYFDLSMIQK